MQRGMRLALDFVVYLLVRVVICVVQALTDPACVRLSRSLAWMCHDLLGVRARVVDDNLRHAFPDMTDEQRDAVRRGMWLHLMLLFCEMARASRKVHETNWREFVQLEGSRQIVSLLLRDEPVVIVTSHFGNFEFSGYLAGLFGFPTVTLARPLDNRFLNRFLLRFRQSTGQTIIPSSGTAELAESLMQSQSTLTVLGDHYGGPKGCWVEFFHRPASCHKSIGLLALGYKAKLSVVNTVRVGSMMRFKMLADQPLIIPTRNTSLTDVTRAFTEQLEQVISQHPDQYWWLHRRWKDTRQERKMQRRQRRMDSAAAWPGEFVSGVPRPCMESPTDATQ